MNYKENKYLFIGIALILATFVITGTIFLVKWYKKRQSLQVYRGPVDGAEKLGLNNPLNIRATNNSWLGETTQEGDAFESFSSLEYGLRAGMKLIYNYLKLHGDNTLTKIITRYAPKSDGNPTSTYITNVSDWSGIPSDQVITADDLTGKSELMTRIIAAILRQEQGADYKVPFNELKKAYDLFIATL